MVQQINMIAYICLCITCLNCWGEGAFSVLIRGFFILHWVWFLTDKRKERFAVFSHICFQAAYLTWEIVVLNFWNLVIFAWFISNLQSCWNLIYEPILTFICLVIAM